MGEIYRCAGTPEGYSKIMFKSEKHTEVFDRAMSHIRYAVELKKIKFKSYFRNSNGFNARI